eukprot:gnl/TRDRNA2_/TRDRNA2_130356_c0_seq3.p1 gnl/TRDRNA2_/TRDRNA2_130356_c0~~gnl/TRDRNA2_/TRDRNA2_130356_c0_seq3.p1  ORF type:complete len:833 (+),score=178.95 gnl/TRDRNA2_/TRDRNA2_130356_c0_seq3:171-2501(+)
MYGPARNAQDYDYRELSVKCLRLLCRLDPAEAREFHNRQRTTPVGRADARMYMARASMEERLGDTAKAVKMLNEGIRLGASPAETLQRALQRLQPSDSAAGGSSQPLATPLSTAGSATNVSIAAVSASLTAAAKVRPTANGRTAPRILGLGCPMRNMDEGNEDEELKAELRAEAALAASRARMAAAESSKKMELELATGTMSMILSPIKEVDSPEKARNSTSGDKNHLDLSAASAVSARGVSQPPGGCPGTPAQPDTGGSGCVTPGGVEQELSCSSNLLLAEPVSSELRKASKAIVVNGVSYTQLQTIGRGGSSKVYLVQNPDGGEFALKRVATDCPRQLEAFQNEVTLLQQLKDQEHVIQVLDAEVDRERGRIHIVMEAGDMDLGRFLQAETRLSLAQIQHLWRQMLEAVQVIHDARIVHSDLKPGNFLLVRGVLKVIDFGIAKRIANDTTNISRDTSVGTLSYMAPESVKQGQLKIGRASDIWSLGIILYQMVYEHPPFAHLEPMQRLLALSDPQLTLKFPPGHRLEHHSANTKAQLVDILEGCLQRDARKRPSLGELLSHPFLSASAEVPRGNMELAVKSLMSGFLRIVGDELQLPDLDADLQDNEWQELADEVWDFLAHGASAGEASRPALEMHGLASLRQRFRQRAAAGRQAQGSPAAKRQAFREAERPSKQLEEPKNLRGMPEPPPAPVYAEEPKGLEPHLLSGGSCVMVRSPVRPLGFCSAANTAVDDDKVAPKRHHVPNLPIFEAKENAQPRGLTAGYGKPRNNTRLR